jgi:hypothetical protein
MHFEVLLRQFRQVSCLLTLWVWDTLLDTRNRNETPDETVARLRTISLTQDIQLCG